MVLVIGGCGGLGIGPDGDEAVPMSSDSSTVEDGPVAQDEEQVPPGWWDDAFTATLEGTIVFVSRRDGIQPGGRDDGDGTMDDVFVMAADGSDVRRVTSTPPIIWSPDVSPDGRSLVFVQQYSDIMRQQSPAESGFTSMGVFRLDLPSGLVDVTDNAFFHLSPRWSPDGGRIMFSSDRTGVQELYVMDSDGTNVQRLTDTGTLADTGAWSPDATRIAFASKAPGRDDMDLFMMASDGSDLRQLTDEPGVDNAAPDWSPDGERLVFQSSREDDRSIEVLDLERDERRALTTGEHVDGWPRWSPDGEAIVFVSTREASQDIFVMRADGTGVSNLTASEVLDAFPSWTSHGLDVGAVPVG